MSNIVTENPQLRANELVRAKQMADTLHKHYPDHLWAVTCDDYQGIVTVRNMSLSGAWGFVLKSDSMYSASHFDKEVMRAGGELLERYRVHRGRAEHDELAALPADRSGRLVFQR